jgi:hypothetical protein
MITMTNSLFLRASSDSNLAKIVLKTATAFAIVKDALD